MNARDWIFAATFLAGAVIIGVATTGPFQLSTLGAPGLVAKINRLTGTVSLCRAKDGLRYECRGEAELPQIRLRELDYDPLATGAAPE